MLKFLLKSSVSSFVLLAALLPSTPSQAGNGGGKEGSPETKKIIIKKKKYPIELYSSDSDSDSEFLPKEPLNFEQIAEEGEAEKASIFALLSPEKTVQIFMFLDPTTTIRAELVCRKWHTLIESSKKYLLNILNDPDQKKTPQFLRELLFHKKTFIPGYRYLAEIYFKDYYYPKLHDLFKEGKCAVPEIIENFLSVVTKATHHHPFFVNYILALDPCKNFKEVTFFSHITHETPGIVELLSQYIAKNPIDINQFSKLIKNPENREALQHHLMAIKIFEILSTQEKKFMPQQEQRDSVITHYLENKMNKFFPNDYIIHKNPHPLETSLIEQPFWSTYTWNLTIVQLEWHLIENFVDSTIPQTASLEKIKDFWDFFSFGIDPKKVDQITTKVLGDLENKYVLQNKVSEGGFLLEEIQQKLDKKNLYQVVHVAESYALARHHEKAINLLKEALEEAQESPFRFQILFKIAQFTLNSKDEKQFGVAKEYLKLVLQQFHPGEDELETPFKLSTQKEKESEEAEESLSDDNSTLDLIQIYMLKAAYAIYEGNFTAALEELKRCPGEVFDPYYRSLADDILRVLQGQLKHPNLSKELIKFLGKELRVEFSTSGGLNIDTEEGQYYFLKYPDVMTLLLKTKKIKYFLEKGKLKELKKG